MLVGMAGFSCVLLVGCYSGLFFWGGGGFGCFCWGGLFVFFWGGGCGLRSS